VTLRQSKHQAVYIEKLTLRTAHKPDRELKFPLLASAERARVRVDLLLQVAVLEQLHEILVLRLIARPLHRTPDTQVLEARELREEHVLLRDDADVAARRAPARLRGVREGDGTAGAPEQPTEDRERGRLTCS
jgi:hypothetical protein